MSEIKRHIKPFKDAFNEIKKKIPDIILAIPIHRKNKSLIEREFKNSIIVLSEKEKFLLFKDANVACASSGTVTLELGLSLLPMLVIYKLDFLTWSIVRRLAKVRFISLINLVLNKNSVTELIQNKCNKNNIYQSLLGLFFDKETLDKQINDLKNFRKIILSDNDDPTEKAAKKILEFIEK